VGPDEAESPPTTECCCAGHRPEDVIPKTEPTEPIAHFENESEPEEARDVTTGGGSVDEFDENK
jgi:hypothetical protein